jgi:hypothetical protein
MKVIRQDREAKQIDSELGRKKAELIFDPSFTMVEVFTGD